ncbi:hypothetical protein GGR57DRAFT_502023 [Xylariaceae sp. FL1272]|nr:hypothetical protein GGR57DRAFT_502023 [Xylariaceae sp. FL1272]
MPPPAATDCHEANRYKQQADEVPLMVASSKGQHESSHHSQPHSISKAIKFSQKLTGLRDILDQYVLAEANKDWKKVGASDSKFRDDLLKTCKILSDLEKRHLERITRLLNEHQEQHRHDPSPDHARSLEAIRNLVDKFHKHLGPLLDGYMADRRPAGENSLTAKQLEDTLPSSTDGLENAITNVRIEDVPVAAPNTAGKRKQEQLKGTQTPKKKVCFTVDPDDSPTAVSQQTQKKTIVVKIPQKASARPLDANGNDNTATMVSYSDAANGHGTSNWSEDDSNSVQEERFTSHNEGAIDGDNILNDDSHQMVTRSVRKEHNATKSQEREAKARYDEMVRQSFLAIDDLVYDAPKKKRSSKKQRLNEEAERQIPEMSGALVTDESQLIDLLKPKPRLNEEAESQIPEMSGALMADESQLIDSLKPKPTSTSDSEPMSIDSSADSTNNSDESPVVDIRVAGSSPNSCAHVTSLKEDIGHSEPVIVPHDSHNEEDAPCIDPALLAGNPPTRDARVILGRVKERSQSHSQAKSNPISETPIPAPQPSTRLSMTYPFGPTPLFPKARGSWDPEYIQWYLAQYDNKDKNRSVDDQKK